MRSIVEIRSALSLSFIILSLRFLTTPAIMSKRTRETDQDEQRNSPGGPRRGTTSPASKLNAQVLKKLQKELDTNPEVDLISKFPTDYSNRLTKAKGHKEREGSWSLLQIHILSTKTNLLPTPEI